MQTRNNDVVKRFAKGDYGHDGYGSVKSTEGGALYSYSAKIAEWKNGEIVVHDGWDGYSRTTSKHFKYLHRHLEDLGVEYEATHEPDKGNDTKDRWR